MRLPRARHNMPREIHRGLLELDLPPRKLTGIMMIMDPISYMEAIIPVSVDFSPNLLSIDVITTLTKPLMQTPCMNAAIDRNTKNHFGPRNMFKNFNLMQPNEQSSNTTVSSSLKFSVLAVGVFRFTSSLANP